MVARARDRGRRRAAVRPVGDTRRLRRGAEPARRHDGRRGGDRHQLQEERPDVPARKGVEGDASVRGSRGEGRRRATCRRVVDAHGLEGRERGVVRCSVDASVPGRVRAVRWGRAGRVGVAGRGQEGLGGQPAVVPSEARQDREGHVPSEGEDDVTGEDRPRGVGRRVVEARRGPDHERVVLEVRADQGRAPLAHALLAARHARGDHGDEVRGGRARVGPVVGDQGLVHVDEGFVPDRLVVDPGVLRARPARGELIDDERSRVRALRSRGSARGTSVRGRDVGGPCVVQEGNAAGDVLGLPDEGHEVDPDGREAHRGGGAGVRGHEAGHRSAPRGRRDGRRHGRVERVGRLSRVRPGHADRIHRP